MSCSFCISPDIQERTIVQNEHARAFPTNIPIVPGHILICPIRCIARLEELTEPELLALLNLRFTLKQALIRSFGAAGFNYAWNEGEVAGQSIPHLHLHMLPRKENDTGITEYEPRKFLYRPGSREKSPPEELLAVTKAIQAEL